MEKEHKLTLIVKDVETELDFFFVCVCVRACVRACVCVFYMNLLYCQTLLPTVPFFNVLTIVCKDDPEKL